GVAAGGRGAALVDVSRNNACSQPVPVRVPPAELVHHRRVRERRVRRATGDDDVCVAPERLDDRLRANIRVRALDTAEHRVERPAVVHVAQLVAGANQLFEPVHDIIAADDADLQLSGEPFRACLLEHAVAARRRIHTAGVRDEIGSAPISAFALWIRPSTASSGLPSSMLRSSWPARTSSSSRSMISSPLTTPTFSFPANPFERACSSTPSRHAVGFTPPAFAMTRMLLRTMSGRISPIRGTKSRAYPCIGSRMR